MIQPNCLVLNLRKLWILFGEAKSVETLSDVGK